MKIKKNLPNKPQATDLLIHLFIHVYVVFSISFQIFFVQAFKIVVYSQKVSMLLLYIL